MLPTNKWISAQKGTPSFVTQSGAEASALEQPLPADLLRYGSPTSPHQTDHRTPTRTPTRARAQTPNSSRQGRSSPRRIYEDLIERGRLYDQRREALQEKAIRDEVSRCRSVPKISPVAQQIERKGKIVTRLYKIYHDKERMKYYKDQEMDMKNEKELAEFFKPKLSRKGCRAQGKTMKSQHEMWNSRREEKMEMLKAERIAAQLEDVRDAPEINSRSELLAAKRKEKEGLAGYSHFEAMIERDRLSQLAKWEKRQQRWVEENPGNPRITEYAARKYGDVDVSERLYQHGLELSARKADRARQLAEDSQQRPPRRVGEEESADLLERHEQYVRNRDRKLEDLRERERRAHTPTINRVSDNLASRLPPASERLSTPRRQQNTSARDDSSLRLHSHSSAGVSPVAVTPYRYEYSSHDAQRPTTTETTPAKGSDSSKIYERMQVAEGRRQQRLGRVKDEMVRDELQECTFKPTTNVGGGSVTRPSSMYDRSVLWAKRRDEKVAQERAQLHQEQQPSFSPSVNPTEQQFSDEAGREEAPAGYDAFVHRQEEARRARDPQDPTPGSMWTPQRTVPQEFVLGKTTPVAALSKPVSASPYLSPSYDTGAAAAAQPQSASTPQHAISSSAAKYLAEELISQNRRQYEQPVVAQGATSARHRDLEEDVNQCV